MAQTSSRRPGPFLPLAAEVRQAILCQFDDVATLESASAADRSLGAAFSGAPSIVLPRVLHNAIPSGLLPEAQALQASYNLDSKSRTVERVTEIVDAFVRREPADFTKWALPEARYVSGLAPVIEFFIDDFASWACSRRRNTTATVAPISSSERCRIARAFYRFEIYCNLFRPSRRVSLDAETQEELFIRQFAPWETEQLCCVYDYLVEKITPAFNDIAEHNIQWGEFSVPFDAGHPGAEERYDYVVSLGLSSIYQVVTAMTYEERYEVLSEHFGIAEDFLLHTLWQCRSTEEYGRPLSDYDEVTKQALIAPPALDDPDPGPRDIWYWVHAEDTFEEFIYSDRHRYLRRRGYVLWDVSRLRQEWKFLDGHYADPPDEALEPLDDKPKLTHSMEEMRDSWKQRSKIYAAGGRGWWSKDDESKVVYPTRTDADVRREMQKEPLPDTWQTFIEFQKTFPKG
ncbi:uncharacterized protein GIQ15_02664 [Arthroderma uncinatum]|uniref:uncharacterized protein n=1 Tax=Arthroderma uncinatum TaxID=74035 RepID=UPI00144AC212|nr:uncharacterized protein GIQ15_02664 [Arthroderma uncinatum]KAF3483340.1 hypothetical protein GIQ15_02664 [Arthroderma uncinatum]